MNTAQIHMTADNARYLIEIVGHELRAARDAGIPGEIARCEGILRSLTFAIDHAA